VGDDAGGGTTVVGDDAGGGTAVVAVVGGVGVVGVDDGERPSRHDPPITAAITAMTATPRRTAPTVGEVGA
jgi:hypothetical protein